MGPAIPRTPVVHWVWDCPGPSLPLLTLGRSIIERASSLGSQCTCVLTLGPSVNFHIHQLAAHHHHACCTGSGFRYLGKIWKSSGRRWTGSHKGRAWCHWLHLWHCSDQPPLDWGRLVPHLMVAQHLLSCHLHLCIFPGPHTHTQTQLTQAHACIHTHAQHGDTNMEHGLLKHLCFLFASVSPCRACVCMYVCACVSYVCVCVCVCVCVSGPGQTQRWRWQERRCQATIRGDTRLSQSKGVWSPYLWSDPVQDGNEERTDSDNSGLWLQKSAIRPNTKASPPFLPCCAC